MSATSQYLEIHQSRERDPTDYENLLGDAVERCFANGITDLDALVASLNEQAVPAPGGTTWTVETFTSEMARLGR